MKGWSKNMSGVAQVSGLSSGGGSLSRSVTIDPEHLRRAEEAARQLPQVEVREYEHSGDSLERQESSRFRTTGEALLPLGPDLLALAIQLEDSRGRLKPRLELPGFVLTYRSSSPGKEVPVSLVKRLANDVQLELLAQAARDKGMTGQVFRW